mmetsp:Transcript_128/g.327  ORF Transcript_128/g.327 Transcript_128/m.327 type:complete len:594 (+) Transcript_128:55-1836(+)|eukprot:CAMPEP_0201116020 /NCGR_PEP_ID=MMETSP0850-20130426/400_1 /ASSEMBLY_ACC=CAM_ASM_000622 /TAXON_ID=183588 /ORGANISM="Pseudo-nitzschia fraudulenta, Strain WWA7" /LENGTH=593 /DNA_ID=CAMNT_0047379973 /DNA_START=42 /DNA_END=1823 /DNA_ORIENTATION=-
MCRPHPMPNEFIEVKRDDIMPQRYIDPRQLNSDPGSVTTIAAVTLTFILGYGLGVNNADIRITCFVGVSGLLLFISILNFNSIHQQTSEFSRWLSHKTSFSSESIGRMASKRSGAALSTLSRVTSVDAIKSISQSFLNTLDCSRSIRSAIQSITRKECFARLDFIERLSISDVSILFRYATEANLDVFDEQKFLRDQSQIMRAVFNAIDMAVKVSRGSLSDGITIVSTTNRSKGDVDALLFVAVSRIFAEWRNLRMVPKGYKRYTVALSLAYRDVLQNLAKIERGVHEYLKHHQTMIREGNKDPATPIPSPTLRELLQFEIKTSVHKRLPYLAEKSSASGILWTKRQLQYQTLLISNLLEVPTSYPSAKDAAYAAYELVISEYHGWAIRQIFSHSFGSTPPLDKIWLAMRPPTTAFPENCGDTKKKQHHSRCPPPVRAISDLNSFTFDSAETQEEDNKVLAALDNFRHEIVEKWEDVVRMFNCGKEEKKKGKKGLVLSSESHFDLNHLNQEIVESSLRNNDTGAGTISDTNSVVTIATSCSASSSAGAGISLRQAKVQKSKGESEDFMRLVLPMISDLGIMIDELNINDPSKA